MASWLNLGQILKVNAKKFPHTVALKDKDRKFTYPEVNRRVNKLAHSLLDLGLIKGDKVAVLLENSIEIVEVYLATAKTGLVIVPVNFRLTGSEVAFIVNNSDAQALIVHDEFTPCVEGIKTELKNIRADRYIVVGEKIEGYREYEALIKTYPQSEPEVKVDVKPKDTDDETGTKKGDEEIKSKPEKEADKPGEGDVKLGEESVDKGGDADDPLKDAKPIVIEIDGEKVQGWVAKSGKYIIPYADVEKRDAARRTLRATNEVLQNQARALEANLKTLRAELDKVKAGTVKPEATQVGPVDVKSLAAKVAKQIYAGEEEGMAALEEAFTALFNAGKVAGAATGDQPKGSEEQTIQSTVLTPEEQQRQIQANVAWQAVVEDLLERYPVLKDEEVEFYCYNQALRIMGSKLQGLDEAVQMAWVQNPENMKAVAEEAAKKTAAMVKGPEKTEEEIAADQKKAEDELLAKVATKLNLQPEQIRTLGEVGGLVGEPEKARAKELDNLSEDERAEALAKMTPEEREKYWDAPTD